MHPGAPEIPGRPARPNMHFNLKSCAQTCAQLFIDFPRRGNYTYYKISYFHLPG